MATVLDIAKSIAMIGWRETRQVRGGGKDGKTHLIFFEANSQHGL